MCRGHIAPMPQWVVHRHPRPIHGTADKFRPERWWRNAIKSLPKFAYFPFAADRAFATASKLRLMEMVLILADNRAEVSLRLQRAKTVTPRACFTAAAGAGHPGGDRTAEWLATLRRSVGGQRFCERR